MCVSKASALAILVMIANGVVSGQPRYCGFVPLVAQDATQPSTNSQDDFEEVLAGNQTSLLTGQYLNAFSGSSSVAVNFDASSDSTIIHYAGAPIADNTTSFFTFGYAINAVVSAPGGPVVNPGSTDGYWTPGVTIPGHVPEQNIRGAVLAFVWQGGGHDL